MGNVLRLAIVDPNDTTRESAKSMLLGMDLVWLEAECSRYEFFADVVAQTHPDIGLVALDHDPDKALELVARLNDASPDCSILVVSTSTDGSLILRAMRAGAKEFLTQPGADRRSARRAEPNQPNAASAAARAEPAAAR